jgi:lipopolysaccharide biosynthesis glycosyltransferase
VAETIHIAMAADARYKRQLAVTLCSLAAEHPAGTCSVTVLHDGIEQRDRDLIQTAVTGHVGVTWVATDAASVQGLYYPPGLSLTTMFRLMLPDVLPDHDRTIYLDSDIVVTRPLFELWRRDLRTNLLGAVRDGSCPWAAGPIGTHWRDLGLEPDTPYFNAGVLIIPLSTWRREKVADAALEGLRARDFVYGDQDALNAAVGGHWLELSHRWNLQTSDWTGQSAAWALERADIESALAEPGIIHYTQPGRPWWPGSPHPKSDLWFRYLDQTPWAGWRPPARRPAWREAASRMKRAGRVLVTGT